MNITWLKVSHFFQAVWTWVKGNWVLLLLLAGLIAAAIFAKNKDDNYNALLKEFQNQLNRNHQEIDQLRSLQQQQLKQQQLINQRYNETLDKIQRDYQGAIAALDAGRKKELQKIITNTHDDPDEMAKQINALFGLPIYNVGTAVPPNTNR